MDIHSNSCSLWNEPVVNLAETRKTFIHFVSKKEGSCGSGVEAHEMNLGTDVTSALHLPQAEVPLELQGNFAGIRHIPLFYAGYIRKMSHKAKVQTRLLLCTIDNVYACHPNGDIVRCFPYEFIESIYHDPDRKQVAFIVPREYDMLFAVPDTYHLIHVIETLRSMHAADKPLTVRTLVRQQAPPGERPKLTDEANGDVQRKAATRQSMFEFVKQRLGVTGHRPGVIVGWNDGFVGAWDNGSGENVIGHKNEVALGKDFYCVRLAKPAGWKLTLHDESPPT